MSEALPNGIVPKSADGTITSKPAANGLQTVVKFQRVLSQRYFDVAGFPGRTVGLDAESRKTKNGGEIIPPFRLKSLSGRLYMPMSNMFGSCASGTATPTSVAISAASVRL